MKPIPSKPNAKRHVLRLILSLLIAWAIHLSASSQPQTPTKPNSHITISEIAARNALKYKSDAEFYYRQSAKKDTVIMLQDTVIKKQGKKIFWKGVENWAWRGLAILTAIKLIPKK